MADLAVAPPVVRAHKPNRAADRVFFSAMPFVMLAMDYYPLRRYEQLGWGRLLLEKAALIGLAGAVGVLTMLSESRQGGLMAPLAVSCTGTDPEMALGGVRIFTCVGLR